MQNRFIVSICFLWLPSLLFAQSNVYPAHAFEFDSFPERQFCPCVPNNTPIADWPKCDSWDYRLTKGYSYVFSILNHTSVSCYQIGGVKVPDKELVRFVKPQSGWPDQKMFYYYFPEKVKVSIYAEKDNSQTLFSEATINKDNRFTEVFSKKPIIGGDISSFLIKLTSEANIKTLRMRVQPTPKSGNSISGDSKTFGAYGEVSNSDHEIVLRYFMPTSVHENLAHMVISIYDYNVPNTPTTPQGYLLYAPSFQFATPPVTVMFLQDRNNVKHEIEKKELKSPDQYKEEFKAKIAADGSDKTYLKLSSNEKIGTLRLRVVGLPKSGSASNHREDIGELKEIEQLEKEITYSYTHPNHVDASFSQLGIEVYNTTNDASIYKPPIALVPAPVLMLHGIWSNGKVWESMYSHLLSKGYTFTLTRRPNYPNNLSFQKNFHEVGRNLDLLLEQTWAQQIISGKVDILAHSMGGLLTRQYIQSGEFTDDINKVITLNTPHFGSQLANIVYKDLKLKIGMSFLSLLSDANPFGGALEDLQVNGEAMKRLTSSLGKNGDKVSVHAVVTTRPFKAKSLSEGILEGTLYGLDTALLKLCSANIDPLKLDFNKCLEERIFYGKNDWIVAENSQTGGLSGNAVSSFEEINHLEVHSKPQVQSWVTTLLSQRNSASYFSRAGYQNVPMREPETNLYKTMTPTTGTIGITYPLQNQRIRAGSTLKVNVQGNTDIRNILLGFASDSMNVNSQMLLAANKGTFSIPIPAGLNQALRLAAFGFDQNGEVSLDTMTVHLSTAVSNEDTPEVVENALQFTASPNPATDIVLLQWNTFLEGKLDIYDLQGRLVHTQNVVGFSQSVSVRALPNGLYLAKLSSKHGNASAKFIKY